MKNLVIQYHVGTTVNKTVVLVASKGGGVPSSDYAAIHILSLNTFIISTLCTLKTHSIISIT